VKRRKLRERVGLVFLILFSPVLFIALLVLLFVLLPLYGLTRLLHGLVLRSYFELTRGLNGRRIVLVYSRSPNWQEYIETNWLPKLERHASVVDWSERRAWKFLAPVDVRMFRFHSGDKDFNPIAILFPAGRRARKVRFHQAFRDYKHGKDRRLREAEQELFSFVNKLAGRSA
jgi:hypothetical protein